MVTRIGLVCALVLGGSAAFARDSNPLVPSFVPTPAPTATSKDASTDGSKASAKKANAAAAAPATATATATAKVAPTGPTWTSLWAYSAKEVFAIGGGSIRRTIDGGKSWDNPLGSDADPLYALWGNSAQDVYVVGANGLLMHSEGRSWKPMPTFQGWHQTFAALGGSGSRVLVGGAKFLLISGDGGKSWTHKPVNIDVDTILAASAQSIYLLGHRREGTLETQFAFHSEDGGTRWHSLDGPVDSIWPTSDTAAYAIRQKTMVLSTNDAGKTWTTLRECNDFIPRVVRSHDGTILLAGDTEMLLRSTDGGKSWKNLSEGLRAAKWSFIDISMVSSKEAYGLTRSNVILHTVDAGEHWTKVG
jgi:photosystem II stability/assembly factor-like uncharacterized protein